MTDKLSEAEILALENARKVILITDVPSRNERDVFGQNQPGMSVYKRLEKRGLLIITEEDSILIEDEEFTFTSSVEITDEGKEALRKYLHLEN